MLCYENVKKCNERKREKVRGKKGREEGGLYINPVK